MLLFLSDHWQVLLLPLHHYCLALEQTVYHEVADLALENVASLMTVPLVVNGTPVIRILHSVIDSLGEGRDMVCVL